MLMPQTEAACSTQRLGAAQGTRIAASSFHHRRLAGCPAEVAAPVAGPRRIAPTATSLKNTGPLLHQQRARYGAVSVAILGVVRGHWGSKTTATGRAGHGAPRGTDTPMCTQDGATLTLQESCGCWRTTCCSWPVAKSRPQIQTRQKRPSGPGARSPARLRANADTVLEGSSALAGDSNDAHRTGETTPAAL